MDIPRIIHQTWKTSDIPERFSEYVSSWRNNHPQWDYRLWSDKDNRQLIADHYPWFLNHYDAYPHAIQRADAIRYFILDRFGGLYVDLDFVSLRPIDELLRERTCLLGLEPPSHAQFFQLDAIVSNALMAAVPSHPFFKEVISRLTEFSTVDEEDPLKTTGPFMLSKVYETFSEKDQVDLEPSERLFPLSIDEAHQYEALGHATKSLGEAYAIHLHAGTWWKPQEERKHKRRKLRRIVVTAACVTATVATTLACIQLIQS